MVRDDMGRTLLLIHPGALGDVLLTRSAIRTVRAAFPRHECGLLAGEQVGGLLVACGEVDRLFPLEQGGLAGLLTGAESVAPPLRSWLDKTDLAVGWMKDHEGALAATLSAFGVGRVILRSPFTIDGLDLHQADRYLATVAPAADQARMAEPLRPSESMRQEAAVCLEKAGVRKGQVFVAIHPGSGSLHKCCEPGLYVSLVAQMQAWGVVPILLAGPSDSERVRAIQLTCEKQPIVFEGLELRVVAGLLAQASLYIGHDSGITHLAACLDVPTVALFGPTDPRRWGPRGGQVKVLRGAPCLCNDWNLVRVCTEKRCLQVSAEQVAEACCKMVQNRVQTLSDVRGHGSLPCHV